MPGLPLDDLRPRATQKMLKMRRSAPAPFHKNWKEPKRRATNIVARLGRTCKSKRFPDPKLLDFDGRDSFELLLDRLSLVLGRAFLQRLGGAIDQVLGFLQAE